jgi:hypothetical protein
MDWLQADFAVMVTSGKNVKNTPVQGQKLM